MAAGVAAAQDVPVTSPATTANPTQGKASAAPPAQTQQAPAAAKASDSQAMGDATGPKATVWEWKGLHVSEILFEGVTFDPSDMLPKELPQKTGAPLDPEQVRASMRRLFASGRYRDITVRGVRKEDSVTLIYMGVPRYYVGRVTIDGVKSDRLASLLEFATKLSPGTAFNDSQIAAGAEGIKDILQQQGYYQPVMSADSQIDVAGNQVNVTYTVAIGPQARIGQVALTGADAGVTLEEFRKKGKLKQGSRVTRDTTSNALERLRKLYQKKDRLEATVTLQKQTYNEPQKQVDFEFHANQGPEVKVAVEGAKISKSRLRRADSDLRGRDDRQRPVERGGLQYSGL